MPCGWTPCPASIPAHTGLLLEMCIQNRTTVCIQNLSDWLASFLDNDLYFLDSHFFGIVCWGEWSAGNGQLSIQSHPWPARGHGYSLGSYRGAAVGIPCGSTCENIRALAICYSKQPALLGANDGQHGIFSGLALALRAVGRERAAPKKVCRSSH